MKQESVRFVSAPGPVSVPRSLPIGMGNGGNALTLGIARVPGRSSGTEGNAGNAYSSHRHA